MDFFQLTQPSDETNLMLAQQAIRLNMYEKLRIVDGKTSNYLDYPCPISVTIHRIFVLGPAKIVNKPSILMAAKHFVTAFRMGTLGPVFFDLDRLSR